MTQPIKLDTVFDQAVAYHYGAKLMRLREYMLMPSVTEDARDEYGLPLVIVHKPWARELTYTSGTMVAFAAELYLKGLLRWNGIENTWGHDLSSLFKALPLEVQNAIEKFNTFEMKFAEVLQYAQHNFVEIRYKSLEPDKGFVMTASLVADALHDYLLTVVPNPDRYRFADNFLGEEAEWQARHNRRL